MSPHRLNLYLGAPEGRGGGRAAGAWGPDVHEQCEHLGLALTTSATREIAFQATWQTLGNRAICAGQHAVRILPILRKPEIPYWSFISVANGFDFCSMQIASARVALPYARPFCVHEYS